MSERVVHKRWLKRTLFGRKPRLLCQPFEPNAWSSLWWLHVTCKRCLRKKPAPPPAVKGEVVE